MQTVINAIMGFFVFIIGKPWELVVQLLEWLQTLITQVLPSVIYTMLPDGVAEFLRTLDFGTFDNIVQPVAWFFPVWGILGVYSVAYSMAASIRLIRFIIGFIPTIEG